MINEQVNGGFQPKAPVRESKPVLSAAPVSSVASPIEPLAAAPPSGTAAAATPGVTAINALPAEQTPSAASAVDSEQLDAAVQTLNDYTQSIARTLSFKVEESTGRTVISVYDAETDELIRQIPPEDALQLAEHIQEHNSQKRNSGLLIDAQA